MATKAVDVPPADNLRIWREVEKTDPAHTKKVNQRGGFTAISAHYQVMRATETFGPVGEGWGYDAGEPIFQDSLVIVPVTVWHGNRENRFGPVYGGADWKNGSRLDSDAPKKATTDGLTKALSQLGFNADVFLGRFDDNKYVEEMRAEFNPPANDADEGNQGRKRAAPLDGPYTSKTALQSAVKRFVHELEGCGDVDEFDALLGTDDAKALLAQCERDVPDWMHGGDSVPADFEPLLARIARHKSNHEAAANQAARSYMNAG